MAIERTFSIIKPDATKRNLTGKINAVIEGAGLRIVAQKRVRWTLAQAQAFYAEHAARPFYGELCAFMTSGPIVLQVLEGEGAIAKYRETMGADRPEGSGRRHHQEAVRGVEGRELDPWFGQSGVGRARNRPQFPPGRDRRLTVRSKTHWVAGG